MTDSRKIKLISIWLLLITTIIGLSGVYVGFFMSSPRIFNSRIGAVLYDGTFIFQDKERFKIDPSGIYIVVDKELDHDYVSFSYKGLLGRVPYLREEIPGYKVILAVPSESSKEDWINLFSQD